MVTALLLSACLSFLSTGGSGVLPSYPGQRLVQDPTLRTILNAADSFWTQRNVNGVSPQLLVANSLAGPDAPGGGLGRGAAGDTPTIFLDGRYVGGRLNALRTGSDRARANAVKDLYSLLVHEDGHARGLNHTPTGVMDPVTEVVPGDWASVARQLGITRFPRPLRGVKEG